MTTDEPSLGADMNEAKTEIRALTPGEARELDRTRGGGRTARILSDADQRDGKATTRDALSDERDRVADRDAFLDPSAGFEAITGQRRPAAIDRTHAKNDRAESAEDRAELSGDRAEGDNA
jgi:hypothetical protein